MKVTNFTDKLICKIQFGRWLSNNNIIVSLADWAPRNAGSGNLAKDIDPVTNDAKFNSIDGKKKSIWGTDMDLKKFPV